MSARDLLGEQELAVLRRVEAWCAPPALVTLDDYFDVIRTIAALPVTRDDFTRRLKVLPFVLAEAPNGDVVFRKATAIYLDFPILRTGLREFYAKTRDRMRPRRGQMPVLPDPLAPLHGHRLEELEFEAFLDLLVDLGAQTRLPLVKISTYFSENKEMGRTRHKLYPGRSTHLGVDEDWLIEGAELALAQPTVVLARCIWNSCAVAGAGILFARFAYNGEYAPVVTPSKIIEDLTWAEWVPQIESNDFDDITRHVPTWRLDLAATAARPAIAAAAALSAAARAGRTQPPLGDTALPQTESGDLDDTVGQSNVPMGPAPEIIDPSDFDVAVTYQFVRPADAESDKLPLGFCIDGYAPFLRAIRFGVNHRRRELTATELDDWGWRFQYPETFCGWDEAADLALTISKWRDAEPVRDAYASAIRRLVRLRPSLLAIVAERFGEGLRIMVDLPNGSVGFTHPSATFLDLPLRSTGVGEWYRTSGRALLGRSLRPVSARHVEFLDANQAQAFADLAIRFGALAVPVVART